ncbi:MAG: DsbA family protein [Chloroflexi bacterium]|nr:DsbA family protein [Chloroflexota bacterium]
MWLDRVGNERDDALDITWKNFQLEQVNGKEGPEWKVWELPDHHDARSLVAAVAGEAALRQGKEAHQRFHLALLTARHGSEERIPLNEDEPIADIAAQVGLDVARFREDLSDPSLLQKIRDDHTEAVEQHGVFGTPTFLFDNGNSVYLKSFIPPEEQSAAFFEHFVPLMRDMPFVGEMKRPQPPWPKGAVK